MAAIISMLRGVNVGGHKKIKMDALRGVYESLGLREPKTYIQSGNVVFLTAARDPRRLAGRIEAAIAETFGFRADVIVRTAADMRAVIARNPFAGRQDIELAKLAVLFLAGDPSPDAHEKIARIQANPEELHLKGRELYIYFPHGMGRSKLPLPAIEKALATPVTGRNWNSVLKLLEIAEGLEAKD